MSDLARGAVRSAAGASNSRSRTACTSVPRVAASLGFSGSRSITRNRYSSGHCMKSPAREGDREAGATAVDAAMAVVAMVSTAASAVAAVGSAVTGCSTSAVSPPVAAMTPSVLVSMTTDHTARH